MFKLDDNFLNSLGLGSLPVDEKNKLLQAMYDRLEMNVGMRLAENMTDAQLSEFEGFIDGGDEPGALRWLETNFPNYKQVVSEELEKLKAEVSQAAPQILAAAGLFAVDDAPTIHQPSGQEAPRDPSSAALGHAQPGSGDSMSSAGASSPSHQLGSEQDFLRSADRDIPLMQPPPGPGQE